MSAAPSDVPREDPGGKRTRPLAPEGEAATQPRSETPELYADRYRILRTLGKGGFGEVFLCEDTQFENARVALKRFKAAEDLVGEVRANHRIRHDRVPQIYGFARTQRGELYCTMEYIEGRSLKTVLEEEARLEPERVCRLAIQILEVLVYAHDRHVVHRDIKPGNLMLVDGPNGEEIRVLDFGIAALLEKQSGVSAQESLRRGFGTPDYISPEQYLGREADGRADVYSLGVLVYQAATGSLPFYGVNAQALAAIRLTAPPADIPAGLVPHWLRGVITRLLEREPEARPTAAEALALFRAASAGATGPLPSPAQRGLFTQRRGALALGGACGLAGVAWWAIAAPAGSDDQRSQPAIARSARIESPLEGSLHGVGPVPVSGSAAGTSKVFVNGARVEVARDGRWQFELADLPEGQCVIECAVEADGPSADSVRRTIRVDRQPPQLGWLTLPGVDERNVRLVATRRVSLALLAEDLGLAGLDSVRLAGRQLALDSDGRAGVEIELAPNERGEASIAAECSDRAGNASSLTLDLLVDAEPPLISIKSPNALERDLFPLGSEVYFEGRVVDEHPARSLMLDGRSIPLSEGMFSTLVSLDALEKMVQLSAVDRAGNQSLLLSVVLRARAEALPEAAVLEPDRSRAEAPSPPVPRLQWSTPFPESGVPASIGSFEVAGSSDVELDSVLVNGRDADVDGRAFRIVVPLTGDGDSFQITALPRSQDGASGPALEAVLRRRPSRIPVGCKIDGTRDVDADSDCAKRVRHLATGTVFVLVTPAIADARGWLYVAETETTVESWRAWPVAAAKPISDPRSAPRRPITGLSFDEVLSYCDWAGFEVPATSDWLRAARKNPGDLYAWGPEWRPGCGNTEGLAGDVAEVGSFPCDRSHCGALDMTGNVTEWCRDATGKSALLGGNYRSSEASAVLDAERFVPAKPTYVGFRAAIRLK